MMVSELIRLLQKIPGDYSVGMYNVPLMHEVSFRHLDMTVGLNNETRRVAISFGPRSPASISELRDTIEVTAS